jgi:hypothetical protein
LSQCLFNFIRHTSNSSTSSYIAWVSRTTLTALHIGHPTITLPPQNGINFAPNISVILYEAMPAALALLLGLKIHPDAIIKSSCKFSIFWCSRYET